MTQVLVRGKPLEAAPDVAEEVATLRSLLLDMFKQACGRPDGLFDDGFVGAYEAAQDYLVEAKLIDADKCIRN